MWGQLLVLAILIAVIALCIRSIVKDHKAGKHIQCGESCSTCGPDGCPFEAEFKEIYEQYMLELEEKAKNMPDELSQAEDVSGRDQVI